VRPDESPDIWADVPGIYVRSEELTIKTSLFSRSPEDAFAYLETVLRDERGRRKAARQTHPERHEYWSRRVAEIDEALGALEVLRPVAETAK